MNIRQKIGLAVITPLFVLSTGYTVFHKIKTEQSREDLAINKFSDISAALDEKSKSDTALFKAQQMMEDINRSKEISQRDPEEQYDIEHNCVECGD